MSLLRGIPVAMQALLLTRGWHPMLAVYLDWPDGAVRAHSGIGTMKFDGQEWTGVGQYGRVEVPSETKSGAARRAALTLLADRGTILAEAIKGRQARLRDCEIWFGVVTERAGSVLATDPARIFRGTVDAVTFNLTGADDDGAPIVQAGIQITVVSGPPVRRSASQHHTQEDQNEFYPADTAGRHVQAPEAASANRTWPE